MADIASATQLIHPYVETLIWPALAATGILAFRRSIAELIGRITSAEGPGGWKLDIGNKIETLERHAEANAAAQETQKQDLQAHVEAVRQQDLKDHDALSLVDMQLSETVSYALARDGGRSDAEVAQAVKAASPVTQKEIFKLAQDVRKNAWQQIKALQHRDYEDERERELELANAQAWMRRTIPIFKALTETEHGTGWHRYYAQLGYALKDTGQVAAAKAALDKALQYWDEDTGGAPLSPHYAYNWAVCRIMMDNDARALEEPTDAQTRFDIAGALKRGLQFHSLREALLDNEDVKSWLVRNHLNYESLD